MEQVRNDLLSPQVLWGCSPVRVCVQPGLEAGWEVPGGIRAELEKPRAGSQEGNTPRL